MAKQLLVGEQEILTARQHWSVFLPVMSVTLVVVLAVGVLLKVLPGDVSGHSLHDAKVVVLFATLLLALIVLTLKWLRWRFTTYELTSHRIVVSRGVLSRFTESITLDRIQDVSVRQGLLGRMFKAGHVEIESAGRESTEVLHQINDPQGFSHALQYAQEARRGGQPYSPSLGQGAAPAGPLPQGYAPPGPGQPPGGYGPPPGYTPPRDGL